MLAAYAGYMLAVSCLYLSNQSLYISATDSGFMKEAHMVRQVVILVRVL